jgi:hypothetical protein
MSQTNKYAFNKKSEILHIAVKDRQSKHVCPNQGQRI